MSLKKKSIVDFKVSSVYQDLFKSLSKDISPVHTNLGYCRRTPFGKPIVFGALVVLLCHRQAAPKTYRKLNFLKAAFKHPLFWDQHYKLKVEVQGTEIFCSVKSGNLTCVTVHFSYEPASAITSGAPKRIKKHLTYRANKRSLKKIDRLLNWKRNPQDNKLIELLSWISSYTGVIAPGPQALLAEFEIELDRIRSKSCILDQNFDNRFNILITTAIFENSLVKITALKRPSPVAANPIKAFQSSNLFHNQKILLTGGSRGFGLSLSKVLNQTSAQVLAPARKALDLEIISSVKTFVRKNLKFFKDLDIVILNASGNFEKVKFADASIAKWLDEINLELKINLLLFHEIIPHLKKPARVIFISSIYVKTEPHELSSYVISKAISELAIKYASKENPELNVSVYRMPKFLSDRTNVLFKKNDEFSDVNKVVERFVSFLQKNQEI